MKKLFALILSVCVLLVSVPVSANAIADDTQVINKHGTRTYMGAYSAWNDNSWDSENFTDVTGENVETSDNLIIKGGKVGNVSVDDSADVTIYDGTAADVTCDGCITMAGGSANSLKSSQDINISGGLVQKNVEAEQAVTLTGKLTVCGGVTGNDVTVYSSTGGSDMTAVTGTVSFSDLMTLEGKNYKFGGVDGQSSGTITLSDLTGTLPTLSNTTGIRVKSGSTVTADKSLDFGSLFIEDGGVFLANSSLQVGTLGGPGTLLVKSGSLTVTSAVSDHPILDFNGTAGNGTNVFRASSGTVAPGDVTVCGYSLTKTANSDGYDYFSLAPSKGDGVSLSPSSVTVKSGEAATVSASVTPSLSSMADGTKLKWRLTDPSSLFSILPDTGNGTCKVYLSSAAGSTAYKATLSAYLADSNDDILPAYVTGSCAIASAGSSPADNTDGSDIRLDTASVNIPVGSTYSVLAVTNSATPPKQMSYNSSVAVVGKATAYNSNGRVGWLYPVTAVSKGGVTINIGGKTMIANVTNGCIIVDTASYTLSPEKTYTIGVKLYGAAKTCLNVHSANSCTTVQYKGKSAETELYSVKANSVGTGYVIFDTAAGGSVKTEINVIDGAPSSGVSGRLTAIA